MPRSELHRLRLLQRLNRAFHASLDLAELLPCVLHDTVEALEAEAGSLWLLDDSGRQLVCQTAIGPAPQLEGVTLPLGAGIVGAVAAARRSEIVADASRDQRFLFQVDEQTGFVTRSVVAAPLLIGDRCLGAIQVLNCRAPTRGAPTEALFQQEDLEFLEAIAADAAQALENARLFASAQRSEDLATLLRLARELTATLNTQELLEHLVQSAAALTGCDRAAVALLPVSGAPLRISASVGADSGPALARRMQGLAHHQEEIYVPDLAEAVTADEPGSDRDEPPQGSLLALPLRDADGAVGLLYLESSRKEAFSSRQRELASILGSQATVAIRNALLYRQAPLLNLERWREAWRSPSGLWEKGSVRTVVGLAVLGLGLALLPWNYRVGGRFQIRPSARVEVTAQTSGTVRQVLVREGQPVQSGEVLAILEDQEGATGRAGEGVDGRVGVGVGVGGPILTPTPTPTRERSDGRPVLRSPLAGVVLTPRLEQRVGELLSRGDAFCQVGVMDPLEVEIQVPEDRVPEVALGQVAFLKLSALPGRRFQVPVTRISAVARTGPSGTFFPVVCSLANPNQRFRPGQEGWAKISVGRRSLGYVLLKRAWDHARLWWWRLW